MRKLSIVALAAFAVVCACFAADIQYVELTLDMTGITNGTATTTSPYNGYIDAVHLFVSDGVSTGTVGVAIIPHNSLVAAINVSTGEVEAVKTFRPRVDVTDIAGAALTSDGPERFMLAGDKLRLTVDPSPSNVVWKAIINLVK